MCFKPKERLNLCHSSRPSLPHVLTVLHLHAGAGAAFIRADKPTWVRCLPEFVLLRVYEFWALGLI